MTIDDLMRKEEVASLLAATLKVSLRHAKERIMKRTDFPKPRRQVGVIQVFARPDVEKWLNIK